MAFKKILDQISEQVWFQELKSKWDEIDPQSQQYLKMALAGTTVIVVLGFTWTIASSVSGLRTEYRDKKELLQLLQSANQELRSTRGGSPARASANPTSYLKTAAQNSGIKTVSIMDERPGAIGDVTEEALFNVDLKRINIKQLVQYSFGLETGAQPVKIRHIQISPTPGKDGPLGYLDALLAVSFFKMKDRKK